MKIFRSGKNIHVHPFPIRYSRLTEYTEAGKHRSLTAAPPPPTYLAPPPLAANNYIVRSVRRRSGCNFKIILFNSILYFNVLTQQLQTATESAQEDEIYT
jgi:hypothetical protein